MVPKLFTVHACGAVFGGDRKCVNKTVAMKTKLCDEVLEKNISAY